MEMMASGFVSQTAKAMALVYPSQTFGETSLAIRSVRGPPSNLWTADDVNRNWQTAGRIVAQTSQPGRIDLMPDFIGSDIYWRVQNFCDDNRELADDAFFALAKSEGLTIPNFLQCSRELEHRYSHKETDA